MGSVGMATGELKQQFRESGLHVIGVDLEQMVVRLVGLRGDVQGRAAIRDGDWIRERVVARRAK